MLECALIFSITIALIVLLIYIWLRQRYTYWEQRNIPFLKPKLLYGNLQDLIFLRTTFGELFRSFYDSMKANSTPVVGIYVFHTPALVIRDPELIRLVLIKNFHMFLNRYEAADALHDSLGSLTLPLAKYTVWRESRKRISELFTTGRLKQRMYPLMLEVTSAFERHMARRCQTGYAIIEVKELCALFTTDVTALLMYSIRARSLQGNLTMRQAIREMFEPNFRKALNFMVLFFLPHLTTLLHTKVFPATYVEFIRKMLLESIRQRNEQAAAAAANKYNHDLIDLLLAFQRQSKATHQHAYVQHTDFIVSQAAIMLLAGFETSSSLIGFVLYELAKQPALQQQLRAELTQCFGKHASVELEVLQSMPYLNMVVAEGLRMYPAAAFINRECTPSVGATGFSLKPYVDFELPRGMPAYISILGLQRDEQYWPNPDHFDPLRFTPENAKLIHPMTYIPFGAGPHSCVGTRLGIIQVKLGLAHILKDYKVEFCQTTPREIVFDPTSFMLQNKGGIDLKFTRHSI